MQTILMCPPKFYDVEYSINPWMDGNLHRVDKKKAVQQYNNLKNILNQCGATVVQTLPHEGLPDMVFTANAGLYVKEHRIFIPSNFSKPERQGERTHFINGMRVSTPIGFEVVNVPSDIFFEGAGDALVDETHPRLLWLGYGKRSQIEAKFTLEEFYDVQELELVTDKFYHLDTCFMPLPGGIYLANGDAFDRDTRNVIFEHSDQVIWVSPADAARFACNCVVLRDTNTLVMNTGISPYLVDQLEKYEFNVVTTSLSEFLKAGGAAKCLTLDISA
jgi:N-dimethylarginine dimethylaminohydrolase